MLDHPFRTARGIAHKSDIAPVLARLGLAGPGPGPGLGDDCAVIPDGDGYLLLAIEGFLNEFVASDPWFAGWCGVMVNASDVAAMGGRPRAVVDALWSNGLDAANPILDGLVAGAAAYGIPIVGGHTNTRNDRSQLSVAILGRASRLITSLDARPGDALLAAIDLRGRMRTPAPWWDASSHVTDPDRRRDDLALLPALAEAGLCRAGKDISMGGLIGTALMLAETSRVGMTLDPGLVPRPDGVDLTLWLTCFPSYGFLLAAAPADAADIIARFASRDIACAAVGACDATRTVRVAGDTVWDFEREPLILPRPV